MEQSWEEWITVTLHFSGKVDISDRIHLSAWAERCRTQRREDSSDLLVDAGHWARSDVRIREHEGSLQLEIACSGLPEVEWLVLHSVQRSSALEWAGIPVELSHSEVGPFGLVEAARVLPSWVHHDRMGHRWWILDGVHLLLDALPDAPLSLSDALECIRLESVSSLRAPAALESAVCIRAQKGWKRLVLRPFECYATMTAAAAGAFAADPCLVYSAARAILAGDPADRLVALRPQAVGLSEPSETPVRLPLRLSRVLYAELAGFSLAPPRGWFASPMASEHALIAEAMAAYELGYKLACGLEILIRGRPLNAADDRPWPAAGLPAVQTGHIRGNLTDAEVSAAWIREIRVDDAKVLGLSLDFGESSQRSDRGWALNALARAQSGDELRKLYDSAHLSFGDLSWLLKVPKDLVGEKGATGNPPPSEGQMRDLSDKMRRFLDGDEAAPVEGVEMGAEEEPASDEEVSVDPRRVAAYLLHAIRGGDEALPDMLQQMMETDLAELMDQIDLQLGVGGSDSSATSTEGNSAAAALDREFLSQLANSNSESSTYFGPFRALLCALQQEESGQ